MAGEALEQKGSSTEFKFGMVGAVIGDWWLDNWDEFNLVKFNGSYSVIRCCFLCYYYHVVISSNKLLNHGRSKVFVLKVTCFGW